MPEATISTLQLVLSNLPVIISSLATLIVAVTGFKQMQRNQVKMQDNQEKIADFASAAATSAADAAIVASEKVETVRTTLADTQDAMHTQLRNIQRTSDDTHTLVNGNMGIQLKVNAVKSRRLADITKDPIDILEADEADRALEEHMEKQAALDKSIAERQRAMDKKDDDKK